MKIKLLNSVSRAVMKIYGNKQVWKEGDGKKFPDFSPEKFAFLKKDSPLNRTTNEVFGW